MADFDWLNPDYETVFATRVERLERMRGKPEIVARLIDYYAGHPADWISDWGMTFDPRLAEKGLRTVVPFVLFPKQREFINWCLERWLMREDGVVEKSRDAGVSWLCVAFAAWMMIFKVGTVVGLLAKANGQSATTFRITSWVATLRAWCCVLVRQFATGNLATE